MTEPQAEPFFTFQRGDAPGWSWATLALAGLALLQFGSMAILWFVPYHTSGLINELGLALLAALLGTGAYALLRRVRSAWPARRAAFCSAAACYAIASMAGLGWSQSGPGLGAYRYALFSTPECDFTARFATPPDLGRLREASFEISRASIASVANFAILADLHNFSSYRAECQSGSGGALAPDAVQALSLQWAQKAGLKITHQTMSADARGGIVSLEGEFAGSIVSDLPGAKPRTLVGLRSYIGPHSIMTVYVFQPLGEDLSEDSRAFLDAVALR